MTTPSPGAARCFHCHESLPATPVRAELEGASGIRVIEREALAGMLPHDFDRLMSAEADELTKQRTSVMNGSFLRASLFTSVLSYGVCLFAIGVGLTLIILGWALNKVSSQTVPVVAGNGATRA